MVYATSDFESKLWEKGFNLVCGVDEVGRGCFAGPVVAGAVVFSQVSRIPEGIADSKLLKPKQREDLSKRIQEAAVGWAVSVVDVGRINDAGIGVATQLAFEEAVNNLSLAPDFIIVDAFYIKALDRAKQKPVKNGDKLCASIAAASIVAKVFRDGLMIKLHSQYPAYNFGQNKGYGTKFHREAIKKFGLTEMHRKSFNLDKYI